MQFVHLNKYMFKQHFERVRKITNDGIKYKKKCATIMNVHVIIA